MNRFFLVLLIALSTSYACQAEPDTAAIAKFAQEIMRMDRDILNCKRKLEADQLSIYYSNDYMKRATKVCDRSENNPYQHVRLINLDGASPRECHDDVNAVAACFKEYIIDYIKNHADKAEVKVTYKWHYYTILMLVHEDGKWKLDDASLIDPNTKGVEGYDESIYSFKTEVDRDIERIDKQKKEESTIDARTKDADPTP